MVKANSVQLNALVKNCENTARLLKSLAHPQRLQVLCYLSEKDRTVGELERLCKRSQSAISQFLGRMKAEGLVTPRRDGQFVNYSISDPKVLSLIQALHKIFCP
jgi:DNA-binding transcriptional ArsR family regulator